MTELCDRESFEQALFNIPADFKNSHCKKGLELLKDGIERIDKIMQVTAKEHDHYIEYAVKYSELNIKFLFMSGYLKKSKKLKKRTFDLYFKNMLNLFLREITE